MSKWRVQRGRLFWWASSVEQIDTHCFDTWREAFDFAHDQARAT